MNPPSYSDKDIAERGDALYERCIRAKLEAADRGKFLVVDVETGAYEVDADELKALRRARSKHRGPSSLYMLRVGFPTAYRLGRGARLRGGGAVAGDLRRSALIS